MWSHCPIVHEARQWYDQSAHDFQRIPQQQLRVPDERKFAKFHLKMNMFWICYIVANPGVYCIHEDRMNVFTITYNSIFKVVFSVYNTTEWPNIGCMCAICFSWLHVCIPFPTHLMQLDAFVSGAWRMLMHQNERQDVHAWWRHQMETFSAPLAFSLGNSPVTRTFDVFFGLRLDKRLSKQSRRWWFETPSCSLWRQCNGLASKGCRYCL